MLGIPVSERKFDTTCTLEVVKEFSLITREMTKDFIKDWTVQKDSEILEINSKNGRSITFPYRKLLSHIISHEIHRIGQLSIWARELDKKPVNCDLLIRDIKKTPSYQKRSFKFSLTDVLIPSFTNL